MTKKEYSLDDVATYIRKEGMYYALIHYFDVNGIKDKKLRKMCVKAEGLLKEISLYLEENVSWYKE